MSEVTKRPVTEILDELGLPHDSTFLGYVIFLNEEEEYVSLLRVSPARVNRAFCKTPHKAKVFISYKKAIQSLKHIRQMADVQILFDVGEQLIVVPVD